MRQATTTKTTSLGVEAWSWEAACDIIIAVSYFLIPMEIALTLRLSSRHMSRRVSDEAKMHSVLFMLFIFSCGLTHLGGAFFRWSLRLTKPLTAVASALTALALLRWLPVFKAVTRYSPAELTNIFLTNDMLVDNDSTTGFGMCISLHNEVGGFEQYIGDATLFARSTLGNIFECVSASDAVKLKNALLVEDVEAAVTRIRLEAHASRFKELDAVIFRKSNGFVLLSRLARDAKAEAALQYAEINQARIDHLATVAHDIKTPVSSFLLSLELTQKAIAIRDLDNARDLLNEAESAAEFLRLMVMQALEIAHTGSMVAKESSFRVETIKEKCTRLIAATTASVPVNIRISPNVSEFVTTDRDWLIQNILSYLTNATKHTRAGSIDVNISSPDGSCLLVSVKDTGCGVPEEKRAQLFGGVITNPTSTSTIKGSGVGLYGVTIRTRILGGECGYEPLSPGSHFWFTVPCKSSSEAPNHFAAKPPVLQRAKILVVEDTIALRHLVVRTLAKAGHDVDVANNGKEGIEKIIHNLDSQHPKIDVILTDINMPVLGGLEMARAFFARYGQRARVALGDEKTLKDPVVRHDAKQCGQYLCPAFPAAAEKYILNGCDGTFSTELVEDEKGVRSSTLAALASVSAATALVVGFFAGAREQTRKQGYLPVRSTPLDDVTF
ncbi:hypothetical protein CTAYLR_000156 [Chrysophaeum taylorii]|uniref:histidine kinase n=1 Tax=Chrysophaeum taylorii TaxID=2483200 RepID=A0AAD7XNH3_9STRA|nr:hypothetical protein CTAYLR_000156 [Chrysophaeum taylorii]